MSLGVVLCVVVNVKAATGLRRAAQRPQHCCMGAGAGGGFVGMGALAFLWTCYVCYLTVV